MRSPHSSVPAVIDRIPGPLRGALATLAAGGAAYGLDFVDRLSPETGGAVVLVYLLGGWLVEVVRKRRRVRAAGVATLALMLTGCGAPLVLQPGVCVDGRCLTAEVILTRAGAEVEVMRSELGDDITVGVVASYRGQSGTAWVAVEAGEAHAGWCVDVLTVQECSP